MLDWSVVALTIGIAIGLLILLILWFMAHIRRFTR